MSKVTVERFISALTFPATMMSVPLESDDDSDLDDHIPLRRNTKRAAIQSDSDDEWTLEARRKAL